MFRELTLESISSSCPRSIWDSSTSISWKVWTPRPLEFSPERRVLLLHFPFWKLSANSYPATQDANHPPWRARGSCGSFPHLESLCWVGALCFLSTDFQMPLGETINLICWFLLCVSPVSFYLGSADAQEAFAPIGWAVAAYERKGSALHGDKPTSISRNLSLCGSAMHTWK